MAQEITVIKNDYEGNEVWRYTGRVVEQTPEKVVLEAAFNRDDVALGFVTFERGDRFVETYYTDRWYNIFEIHAREGDALKGWYCNFTRPAVVQNNTVEADDLALDLFVRPDGEILELDWEEFEALDITVPAREAVLDALKALHLRIAKKEPPFDQLP